MSTLSIDQQDPTLNKYRIRRYYKRIMHEKIILVKPKFINSTQKVVEPKLNSDYGERGRTTIKDTGIFHH